MKSEQKVRLPINADHVGTISLTVPALPEAVRVIRSVMRAWASRSGLRLDEIEEICLAADEAFAGLVSTVPVPSTVTVRVKADGAGIDMLAVRDSEAELWPPVSAQTALVRRVLITLIDEVSFEHTEDGPAIHMVKKRKEQSDAPAGA